MPTVLYCQFPPQVGMRRDREYSYLYEGESPETAVSAVVQTDYGPALVRVKRFGPYVAAEHPYKMKYVVAVVHKADYIKAGEKNA